MFRSFKHKKRKVSIYNDFSWKGQHIREEVGQKIIPMKYHEEGDVPGFTRAPGGVLPEEQNDDAGII